MGTRFPLSPFSPMIRVIENSVLALVSMAPLGGPVVPDVYTSVITSSGRASAMRPTTASGFSARCCRPAARKSSQSMSRSSG